MPTLRKLSPGELMPKPQPKSPPKPPPNGEMVASTLANGRAAPDDEEFAREMGPDERFFGLGYSGSIGENDPSEDEDLEMNFPKEQSPLGSRWTPPPKTFNKISPNSSESKLVLSNTLIDALQKKIRYSPVLPQKRKGDGVRKSDLKKNINYGIEHAPARGGDVISNLEESYFNKRPMPTPGTTLDPSKQEVNLSNEGGDEAGNSASAARAVEDDICSPKAGSARHRTDRSNGERFPLSDANRRASKSETYHKSRADGAPSAPSEDPKSEEAPASEPKMMEEKQTSAETKEEEDMEMAIAESLRQNTTNERRRKMAEAEDEENLERAIAESLRQHSERNAIRPSTVEVIILADESNDEGGVKMPARVKSSAKAGDEPSAPRLAMEGNKDENEDADFNEAIRLSLEESTGDKPSVSRPAVEGNKDENEDVDANEAIGLSLEELTGDKPFVPCPAVEGSEDENEDADVNEAIRLSLEESTGDKPSVPCPAMEGNKDENEDAKLNEAIRLSLEESTGDKPPVSCQAMEWNKDENKDANVNEAIRLSLEESTGDKSFMPCPAMEGNNDENEDANVNEAIRLSLEELAKPHNLPITFRKLNRYEFQEAVESCVKVQGGYEKIESGSMIKDGNADGKKKSWKKCVADGGGNNQTGVQYGRYTIEGMWRVFDVIEGRGSIEVDDPDFLEDASVRYFSSTTSKATKKQEREYRTNLNGLPGAKIKAFVDIGHGMGIQVMQAGWALGVPSRGVELMKGRHAVAENIRDNVLKRFRRDPPDSTMVELELKDFSHAIVPNEETGNRDDRLRSFLLFKDKPRDVQRGLVIFINNAQEVFAARSNQRSDGECLDAHLATLFANMQVGGRMVTLTDVSSHLTRSSGWFRRDTFQSGTNAVSWGRRNKSVEVHVLTKLNDEWFCQDGECESKRSGYGTAVVDYDGDLCEHCMYCGEQARRCLRQ